MASIIGSETEFGLTVKNSGDDRRVLAVIENRFRCRGNGEEKENAGLLSGVNWWHENLNDNEGNDGGEGGGEESEKEKSKLYEENALRRLGMSGEYLKNGSRFYIDGWHLEYSTPECRSPFDLVAHEKAGELVVLSAVDKARDSLEIDKADLLKRNTGYRGGASYACHENYLLTRNLFGKIVRENLEMSKWPSWHETEEALWVLHLISRQIFTGAGRILPEGSWPKCFVLSQRQKFIEYFQALGTTTTRSIINTRDRPYANPKKFGRLHVICGDSNRSDFSNLLKYGASRLVLGMLEDADSCVGASNFFFTRNPVLSFESVRNKNSIISTDGGIISAIDAQKMILELVSRWYDGVGKEYHDYSWGKEIIGMWSRFIGLLESESDLLYGMLDVFIKRRMFEEALGEGPYDIRDLQSLEYNYHIVRRDSLFQKLVASGRVGAVVGEEKIIKALRFPPDDTRAKTRSFLLGIADEIKSSWHTAYLRAAGKTFLVAMPDPSSVDAVYMKDERELRVRGLD